MSYIKKRPTALRIVNKTYDLQFDDVSEDSDLNWQGSPAMGMCDHETLEILIQENLPPEEELETIIHEILHGIFYRMRVPIKDSNIEEEIVDRLGAGLAQVFVENPDLLNYIQTFIPREKKCSAKSK